MFKERIKALMEIDIRNGVDPYSQENETIRDLVRRSIHESYLEVLDDLMLITDYPRDVSYGTVRLTWTYYEKYLPDLPIVEEVKHLFTESDDVSMWRVLKPDLVLELDRKTGMFCFLDMVDIGKLTAEKVSQLVAALT